MLIVMDYFEIESKNQRPHAIIKMKGTLFLMKKFMTRKNKT